MLIARDCITSSELHKFHKKVLMSSQQLSITISSGLLLLELINLSKPLEKCCLHVVLKYSNYWNLVHVQVVYDAK